MVRVYILILLQIQIISSCDSSPLPDLLQEFSPAFPKTNALRGSGRYLSPLLGKVWSIKIAKTSWFRFEVEPELHSLSVSLNSDSETLAQDQAHKSSFAMISSKLKPGEYSVSLNTTNIEASDQCVNLLLNLQIYPYDEISELFPDTDEYQEGYPQIEMALNDVKDSDAATYTYHKYYISTNEIKDGDSILYTLKFTVPEAHDDLKAKGFSGMFTLVFSICKIYLDNDFLTSGGLTLLFGKSGAISKQKIRCIQTKTCIYSKRININTATIYSAFSPGDYTVALVYKGMNNEERAMLESVYSKIPYSLHIKTQPIFHSEDRFNCDAGHIPHSLHTPGLMDQNGFLRYSDRVMADFKQKVQMTTFKLQQSSLLRVVTIEPSGLNVDIQILKNSEVLQQSNSLGQSDALLIQLQKGEYVIRFSVENSIMQDPRHKFCETFMLEIGISPIKAVKRFNDFYNTDSCENSKQNLDKIIQEMGKSIKNNESYKLIAKPDKFYTLPIKSLNEGEEVLYSQKFQISRHIYLYFGNFYLEIYSDFVVSDLTIALVDTKANKILKGDTSDLLEMGGRRHFQQLLGRGSYKFNILTGPTAKNSINTDEYQGQEQVYQSLRKCAPFQLRIIAFPIDEQLSSSWPCANSDVQILPSTMNTIDKLGIKGIDSDIMPTAIFYSPEALAPQSAKNVTNKHTTTIQVATESSLSIFTENRDSAMKLILRSGKTKIAADEGEKISHTYHIAADLKANKIYTLQVYFYSRMPEKCKTYSINMQISATIITQTCDNKLPDYSIVRQRNIDDLLDPRFFYYNQQGISSLEHEEIFSYSESSPLSLDIPLIVNSQDALLSGHLQTNVLDSPIYFLILDQEYNMVDWGKFTSAHRYSMAPVAVKSGSYWIRVIEFVDDPGNVCRFFSMSFIMEKLGMWDDVRHTAKKNQICDNYDSPPTLNTVGQLESGSMHWRKTQELNVDSGFSVFKFNIQQESVIRAFVEPQEAITFTIQIKRSNNKKVAVGKDSGLHVKLVEGDYSLVVEYTGDPLPLKISCPSYELDLEIIKMDELNTLAKQYNCKNARSLPSKIILPNFQDQYLLRTSEEDIDPMVLVIKETTQVSIALSYQSSLLGIYYFKIIDSEANEIAHSLNNVHYSSVQISLSPNNYSLVVFRSNSEKLTGYCGPAILTINSEVSESSCSFPNLPEKLNQKKDGSASFYSTLGVPDPTDSQIIRIRAPQELYARVMHISKGVKIDSAVYSDKNLSKSVAYSSTKNRQGSYIFKMSPQKMPYYLVITYTRQKSDCPSYQLKIVLETAEKTVESLECKAKSHKPEVLLPKSSIKFSNSAQSFSSDQYAVLDKWIIAEQNKNLPDGVRSRGKKEEYFKYMMNLTLREKAIFTVDVGYDFLTNDISLMLYESNGKARSPGKWSISEDSIETGIEGIELESGNYQLLLSLSLAANHLIQIYSDTDICFPFSFNLVTVPIYEDSEQMINSIIAVIPDKLSNYSPSKRLTIGIHFNYPLSNVENLDGLAYLKTGQQIKKPMKIIVDRNDSTKMRAIFSRLDSNTCYNLVVDPSTLQPQQNVETYGMEHSYCTSGCMCNPKSGALCNTNLECLCENPYTGQNCYECIEGYEVDDDECVKTQEDPTPTVDSIQFNQSNPVTLDSQIIMTVSFSTNPFTSKEAKIVPGPKAHFIKDSFTLVGPNQVKANRVKAKNKEATLWDIIYQPEEFQPDREYSVELKQNSIFDSNSIPFTLQGKIPKLMTKRGETALKLQCINGVEQKGFCVCNDGYGGTICDECAEGYAPQNDGSCRKTKTDIIDKSAHVSNVHPSSRSVLDSGDKILVKITFSVPPYTKDGLLIDNDSNKDYILDAFALNKKSSRKTFAPVEASNKDQEGIEWDIVFHTDQLEPDIDYRLSQKHRVLYTKEGLMFGYPKIMMPVYMVEKSIIISPKEVNTADGTMDFKDEKSGKENFGRKPRQEESAGNSIMKENGNFGMIQSECPMGYTGFSCSNCDMGYTMSVGGICVLSSNFESFQQRSQNTTSVMWIFLYALVGGAVLYGLNKLRKGGNQSYGPIEMRDMPEEEEVVDLHSKKFEHIKLREDYDDQQRISLLYPQIDQIKFFIIYQISHHNAGSQNRSLLQQNKF